MAPVLELETESESLEQIPVRHRVLIAAAVAAVAGAHFRILEIRPVETGSRRQERPRPFLEEVARAARRSRNRAKTQGAGV